MCVRVWTSDSSFFRASFSSRRVEVDDYNILFHIWDTAGQEKVWTHDMFDNILTCVTEAPVFIHTLAVV